MKNQHVKSYGPVKEAHSRSLKVDSDKSDDSATRRILEEIMKRCDEIKGHFGVADIICAEERESIGNGLMNSIKIIHACRRAVSWRCI